MKKLIAFVLVLAFAAPALADDLIPAPWANDGYDTRIPGAPGSTYAQWTYDDPCGVYENDPPEASWFVSHPEKQDPCSWGAPSFAMQYWGSNIEDEDPCMPWVPSAYGRNGLVEFAMGSWDLNNFIHDQPAKDIWLQITYWNGGTEPTEFGFGSGYMGGDEEMGWWEGPLTDLDPCNPEPFDTWDEGGEVWGWWEGPLADWTGPQDPLLETWVGGEQWVDGERVSSQVLGDGWLHDVWAVTLPVNPDWEYVEGGWFGGSVLIDQVVIETLCYVPEPATMVLLGLGSLLMIRRKR